MGTLEYLKYRDTLLKRLLNTTDIDLLRKIEEVLNNNEDDFANELSDDDIKSIELGKSQIQNGEVVSYEEILSRHQ